LSLEPPQHPSAMSAQTNVQMEELSGILKTVIRRTLELRGRYPFDKDPLMERKDIIEYNHRMLASSIEKFNAPAYTAAVQFYLNEKDQEARNACGVIIMGLKEAEGDILITSMGLELPEEDDRDLINTQFGQVCGIIGLKFQKALLEAGFPALRVSKPITHRNNIPQGVEFSYDQYEKMDFTYHRKEVKIFAVELSLTPLSKA